MSKKQTLYIFLIFFNLLILGITVLIMQNSYSKSHKNFVVHGIVTDVEMAGKGSYRYYLKESEVIKSIVFSGKMNIIIGDSISKERNEFYSVFTKDTRGKFILKEEYLRW